jgi:hypothetical protein
MKGPGIICLIDYFLYDSNVGKVNIAVGGELLVVVQVGHTCHFITPAYPLSLGRHGGQYLLNIPIDGTETNAAATAGAGNHPTVHGIKDIFMIDLITDAPPFFGAWVLRRHLGIYRERAGIEAPETSSLPLKHLVVDIKTVASGAKQGAYTAANAFGGDALPVILILKNSQ